MIKLNRDLTFLIGHKPAGITFEPEQIAKYQQLWKDVVYVIFIQNRERGR